MVRLLTAAAACLVLAACRPPAAPAPPAAVPPSQRTRAAAQPDPALAILTDADVGARARESRDGLGAARDQAGEAQALEEFTSWGRLQASRRTWPAAVETEVLTAREDGARRAFAHWAVAAWRAPYSAGPCPGPATAFDQCRLGVAGGAPLVSGRLGSEAFRLGCPAAQVDALLAALAARLRRGGTAAVPPAGGLAGAAPGRSGWTGSRTAGRGGPPG